MRKLALVVVGVCLGAILAEVAARQLGAAETYARLVSDATADTPDRWVSHPFFPFAGVPNAEYTFRNSGERGEPLIEHVRTNEVGYRSHPFPGAKSRREYRVVALGGSTTYGVTASNAETWPELLEGMLQARHPEREVRVFNLGTQRGSTTYSVVTLGLNGIHLDPDLVITYHGCNDIAALGAANYRWDHAHFYQDLAPERVWRGFLRNLPRSLLGARALVVAADAADKALAVNVLAREVDAPRRAHGDPLHGVQGILANLDTIASIARGQGATALFSTFQFKDGRTQAYKRLNDIFRGHFDTNEYLYVDQDALLPDFDRSLQIDLCHFTQQGRVLVARNFAAYIETNRLMDRGTE